MYRYTPTITPKMQFTILEKQIMNVRFYNVILVLSNDIDGINKNIA
jgi:hypothetical protein